MLNNDLKVITQTKIKEYPLVHQGKVRDIYQIDQDVLLIVTTDRMSAFDVVLPDPIPYKGIVLNQLTIFWMEKFKSIVDNHLLEVEVSQFPAPLRSYSSQLEQRSVLVRKTRPLPLECIVRGYIIGSGWKDYLRTGEICGHKLPPHLKLADKLEPPLFTPSTKAERGKHDQNISLEQAQELLSKELLEQVQSISLKLYTEARDFALDKEIIIADTKFEFGLDQDKLYLIDEVLTPDSSRFWPKQSYEPGQNPPSFDKQFLRDWLINSGWDQKTPAPKLPPEIIIQTQKKYFQIYKLLTGKTLNV